MKKRPVPKSLKLNFVEDIRGEIEAVVGMNLDRHFEFFMLTPDPLIKVTYMVIYTGWKIKKHIFNEIDLGTNWMRLHQTLACEKSTPKQVPS